MIEDERKRTIAINRALAAFNTPTTSRNPLVAALEEMVTLDPYPACATCPAAFWFWDTELSCFCKVKKDNTWGHRALPVRACAERNALLAQPNAPTAPPPKVR